MKAAEASGVAVERFEIERLGACEDFFSSGRIGRPDSRGNRSQDAPTI
jgi:hypothetical protein